MVEGIKEFKQVLSPITEEQKYDTSLKIFFDVLAGRIHKEVGSSNKSASFGILLYKDVLLHYNKFNGRHTIAVPGCLIPKLINHYHEEMGLQGY